jgi:hypothetical protein
MLQSLLALTFLSDLGAALVVFVWWARPDAIVALLLSRVAVVTPRDLALARSAVRRGRLPALLALAGWSFSCGAIVALCKLKLAV